MSSLLSPAFFFFFNDTATTEIYTLSLHDALPICQGAGQGASQGWLDLPDAQGGPLRAFFSKSAQGWTWVSWVPCSALDPACSRPLKGVIWVAIVLFAVAGLGLARLALRGSASLGLPATGGNAQDHGQGGGDRKSGV